MEGLAALRVSLNIPKSEFSAGLRLAPATSLMELRNSLFDEAKVSGLTDAYSVLVRRLYTPIHPSKDKYIEDIWTLV